ncbi:MAG: AAA family ATPase [Planctomycetaceae bacterium]|jgi:type II secretory pathway predicted ATPase ExeA|nr:AAA family ATPase [Planctomycetaceae bacterium]
MYESYFGLKRRPFLAVPDTELYFPTPQMEEARLLIERTVRRGEGISLAFGQSGVGKSLLLRLLRKSLESDFDAVSLVSGRINTTKAFLQNILHDLHLPYAGVDETELRLILADYVKTQSSQGLLLLIDESQFLDQSPLDEIRLLLNTDDGSSPLFRVVLAGTGEFEEKLTLPQFEPFNQRVTTRIYLDNLSRTETFQYITWQTNVSKFNAKNSSKQNKNLSQNQTCGEQFNYDDNDNIDNNNSDNVNILRIDLPHNINSASIFTDQAKDEIYRLACGLPRQINQLCDAALQLAAQQAAANIDEILILSAWGKLQQINIDVETMNKRTNKIEKISSESYDEIIARKKNTIRLKEINSHVEYGSLDDDTKNFDAAEKQKSNTPYRVYKPPYPEDDTNELKKFNADLQENQTENIIVAQNTTLDKNETITEIETETENENNSETKNNTNDKINNKINDELNNENNNELDDEINDESDDELDDETNDELDDELDDEIDDESDDEINDDLVEQLISFELSTASIELSGQGVGVNNLLAAPQNESQFLQTEPDQLFVTKIPRLIQKKGARRFIVRFLAPVVNNKVNDIRTVCTAYYCYEKPKAINQGVELNFTVWRHRFVHSWMGNKSVKRTRISTKIFDAENYKNIIAQVNTNTTKFSKIENISSDDDLENLDMNRESLEEYGITVLNGRPQFVRKEPVYVYQTGKNTNCVNESYKIKDKNIDADISTNAAANAAANVETEQQNNIAKIHNLHIAEETINNTKNNNQNQQDKYSANNLDNIEQKNLDQNITTQFTQFTQPEIQQLEQINQTESETETELETEIETEAETDFIVGIHSENIDAAENETDTIKIKPQTETESETESESESDVCDAGVANIISLWSQHEIVNDKVSGGDDYYGGIVLNWVNEPFDGDCGFGVAYREFVSKNDETELEQVTKISLLNPDDNDNVAVVNVGDTDCGDDDNVKINIDVKINDNAKTNVKDAAAFGCGSGVNLRRGQTSFDEHFDEAVYVRRSTITLDEVYQSVRKFKSDPQGSCEAILNVERQIAEAVRRIIAAANKIEFVAEQAEDAGRKVSDAADLTMIAGQKIEQTATNVEVEVKAVIPNYKDLFKQLSDFQKEVSHEIQRLRYKEESPTVDKQNKITQDNNKNNYKDNDKITVIDDGNNLLNQSSPHGLKTYRHVGKRLSKPTTQENITPTAEIRNNELKTIDIKSLFIEGDL